MSFYELGKDQRNNLVEKINREIGDSIRHGKLAGLIPFFADEDTYIRKTAYLAIGRAYAANTKLQEKTIILLDALLNDEEPKVRQTAVNAAGEIGKQDFPVVQTFFDRGLFDKHHSVRNAVIGSVKKMGEKNPAPVIEWARTYLHHSDKEIRREICHGIELRGRTHPEDILPLLKELQHDKTKRVRDTLVHVIGQISYKKGCLEKVMADIITWGNKELVANAIEEIIDVHDRYRNFSFYTQDEARKCVEGYVAGQ